MEHAAAGGCGCVWQRLQQRDCAHLRPVSGRGSRQSLLNQHRGSALLCGRAGHRPGTDGSLRDAPG